MFENDRSAARGLMGARHLVIFEHASFMGNKSAQELFDRVKAERAQERHLAGLRAFRKEGKLGRFILVCREDRAQVWDGIEVLPLRDFLDRLWSDSILERG